jgi:hypothetical protein
MSAHDLQAQFAPKASPFVHLAYDKTCGWWRVFTAELSYGGAAWKDEALTIARNVGAALGREVRDHNMRRKR